MKIALLIFATLAFHLPLGLLKHTIRKYKRMELYNPDEAFHYKIVNGSFSDDTSVRLGIFGFFSGLVIAFVPLYIAFDVSWFIILISNTICLFTISPWIAFVLMPLTGIHTKRVLIRAMLLYFMIGIFLFAFGLIVN